MGFPPLDKGQHEFGTGQAALSSWRSCGSTGAPHLPAPVARRQWPKTKEAAARLMPKSMRTFTYEASLSETAGELPSEA